MRHSGSFTGKGIGDLGQRLNPADARASHERMSAMDPDPSATEEKGSEHVEGGEETEEEAQDDLDYFLDNPRIFMRHLASGVPLNAPRHH